MTQAAEAPAPAFRHILVPTDFSEPANDALEQALDLAARVGAAITLLHVFQLPTFVGTSEVYLPLVELEARAGVALDELAAHARERWSKVTAVLAEGDTAERIVEIAEQRGADLVLIGSHGRRGVARALLGSVAEKVVRLSPVPVLTMHPPTATT